MFKHLALVACFLGFSLAQAQHFNIRHFTVEDGLPSGHVLDIKQDSRGYLWVGTDAGISRYNGSSFINYSLKDGLMYSYVSNIEELDHQRMAFACGFGVTIFDGRKFDNYRITYQKEVIGPRKVLQHDEHHLWVSSRSGLFLLNLQDSSYKRFGEGEGLLSDNVFTLTRTSKGEILVSTRGGICRYNGKKFEPILREKKGRVVYSMIEDDNGYLWYGVLHKILKRIHLDSLHGPSQQIDVPDKEGAFVAAFLSEHDNKVYVGGDKKMLIYEDGQLISQSQQFLDVPSDVVNGVYADNEGSVWAASSYGLWRLSSGFTIRENSETVVGQSIYATLPYSPDSIYYTDGFYIYLRTGEQVHEVFRDKPQQLSEMNDIYLDSKGNWYFGSTLTGLIVRTPDGKYHNVNFTDNIYQRCFAFDSTVNGEVLMGSNNSVYRLNGRSFEDLKIPGMAGQNTLSIKGSPKGGFWFGTNIGLFRYHHGRKQDYTTALQEEEVVVNALHTHHDLLFVGTKGKGIFIFKDKGDTAVLLSRISTSDGLPSDYIVSINSDTNGSLWVSTKRGISKVINPLTPQRYVRTYSSQEGFPNAFWDNCSFRRNKNGDLWIGSSTGLLGIMPSKEFQNRIPPRVQLLHVANGRSNQVEFGLKHLGISGAVSPIHKNDLKFIFNGIQLAGSQNLVYSYMLAGLSREWQRIPGNTPLSINNLAPGKYTLFMRVFDPGRQLESETMSYSFEVSRPYWMSGWFYFGVTLLFLLGIYALFRWRVNVNYRKQHEKMVLNRELSESRYLAFQARMNPHFIFNSLNSIQYFITKNDKKSSLTYLSKFARLLRQVLDNSKALKISLKEEIELLKGYIEMESMRFSDHFSYSFELDENLDPENLDVPGMILQPFVENAIVHGLLHKNSGEGKLTITMKLRTNAVWVEIRDNGVGRKRSAAINSGRKANHKSHGMEIARNRLALLAEGHELQNLITIEDLPEDSGTVVSIQLPLV